MIANPSAPTKTAIALDVKNPAMTLINTETEFKEAILMALLGVLRLENIPNCLASVTGARRDTIGGAVYYGTGN